jgi:hypothetical protein
LENETIFISGRVDYDPEIPSVIIQIIIPDKTGLAGIANVYPKTDGSFSTSIKTGGPTWFSEGLYTIKVSYGGNFEKTIDYRKSSDSVDESTKGELPGEIIKKPIEDNQDNESNNISNDHPDIKETYRENPKLRIPGFPLLDKSPKYYIDRYNSEINYRLWFESQFPEYSIHDVVGFKSTHIANFPSIDNSPQYYINRYENESDYREWFDSQFPNRTIYDVLGFSTVIPDWIKTYANLWSIGDISDSEFLIGLDFMLKNKIIVIPNLLYSEKASVSSIPDWLRNTAMWWSDDLITQHEFINSLKFLIIEEIIEIK